MGVSVFREPPSDKHLKQFCSAVRSKVSRHRQPADPHKPTFECWLGFRVWGLGFGVWGLGFGVWGLGFGVWGLGFGVWGLGFGV